MAKELKLNKGLMELTPLTGKWVIQGSFKNNPTKRVEGWENYSVANGGSLLFCDSETITLWPDHRDVYKNTLNIVYDKIKAKIIGGNEWLFSFKTSTLLIENSNMRFIGEINKSEDRITGKWEVKDKIGHWNYWYDKVLIRTV